MFNLATALKDLLHLLQEKGFGGSIDGSDLKYSVTKFNDSAGKSFINGISTGYSLSLL